MNKIKHSKWFQIIFRVILEPLNIILPKKKRIILYSNWGFRDNVKYMYDYLIENNYNYYYEIVCISDDFMNVDKIQRNNVKFLRAGMNTVIYFLTSKYFIYCFGGIPIRSSSKQTVVNLWHGMPIKRVGLLERGIKHRRLNYFDYILSYSPYFSNILCKSFDVKEKRILIANAPRNIVLSETYESEDINKKKIIAWLPTYRYSSKLDSVNGDAALPFINSEKQLTQLNRLMVKYGAKLFIKLHPLQDKESWVENQSNIKFIDDHWLARKKTDLYSFLKVTDALITDYSSVSIDYLLLDRPIIFAFDDEQKYLRERGLNFGIDEFVSGERASSQEELFKSLSNVLTGKDDFQKLRHQKRNDFYSDISSGSARILAKIGIKKDLTE